MRKHTIGILGALPLLLALAQSASAASVVDITYDLSDTIVLQNLGTFVANGAGSVDVLSGSMKIRYQSNSASSMPILSGPATLQSLALSVYNGIGPKTPYGSIATFFTVAHLNLNLVSPAMGSVLSGGTLTFGAVGVRATGSRHCVGAPEYYASGVCLIFGPTLTSIVGPLGPYTTTASAGFAASPGPQGGAQSTRHTVSGPISAYVPTKFVSDFFSIFFATSVNVVGREILREAEGHDPKVTPIPEPGTLLLLSAGTAGLALVGRATRRSRH